MVHCAIQSHDKPAGLITRVVALINEATIKQRASYDHAHNHTSSKVSRACHLPTILPTTSAVSSSRHKSVSCPELAASMASRSTSLLPSANTLTAHTFNPKLLQLGLLGYWPGAQDKGSTTAGYWHDHAPQFGRGVGQSARCSSPLQ